MHQTSIAPRAGSVLTDGPIAEPPGDNLKGNAQYSSADTKSLMTVDTRAS